MCLYIWEYNMGEPSYGWQWSRMNYMHTSTLSSHWLVWQLGYVHVLNNVQVSRTQILTTSRSAMLGNSESKLMAILIQLHMQKLCIGVTVHFLVGCHRSIWYHICLLVCLSAHIPTNVKVKTHMRGVVAWLVCRSSEGTWKHTIHGQVHDFIIYIYTLVLQISHC